METDAVVATTAPELFANDVEGFLALGRDKTIIDAITQTRQETHQKWQTQFQTTLQTEWEVTKRELLSHMGVQFPNIIPPTTASALTYTTTPDTLKSSSTPHFYNPTTSSLPHTLFDEHTANYAHVVTSMVHKGGQRSIPTPHLSHSYMQEFESYTKPQNNKGAELHDVWKLLSNMIGKATAGLSNKGNDTLRAAYEREDPAIQMQLTEGALAFLQEQYANLIEQENNRQPNVAKHGGVPGEDPTIRAYLNLMPKESKGVIVDGVQPWAYVYYMMRCGWMEHAVRFVERNRDKFGSFAIFFGDYAANKRRLSVQQWENCCKEFNSNVRTQEKDPFKLTVWNLVSRCEVTELRAFRDVIKSTQDFVWYKLMLVSFDSVPEKLKAQELRLQQVQQQLFSLGPGHFTPMGSTPFMYLFVILAVQLFEQALAFLYSSTPYQVEAVHMAIALDFYCLLRVPTITHLEFPVELLAVNNNGKVTLNFPHIIRDYAARLVFTNPVEALSYCALLERNPLALRVCVSDLVFASAELDAFLGSSVFSENNQQSEALVGRVFPKHLREIQILVAQKSQAQGKIEQAVRLYDLAGETEAALQLVIRQLSKMLAVHVHDRQSIVKVAREMQKRLTPTQFTGLQASSLLVAFDQLLNLDIFFSLVASTKFSEALNHMAALHLIPFNPSQIQPCTATFHHLHETVKRLFPEILSTTMQLLTHLHTQLTHFVQGGGILDNSRVERDQNIRLAAKAIVTFCGTIQYQIPKDLTAQLLSSELIIHS
eukprot:Phypoly_transcript_02496.p1 GENE.Phypoly_transcript_02496~~Phypoly_transcript_02496.p1  ORF type:complete len:852 (+),score=162.10 Phypoly_transcript_02496:253-2556(+)